MIAFDRPRGDSAGIRARKNVLAVRLTQETTGRRHAVARTEGRSRIARAAKLGVLGVPALLALSGCSVEEVIRFGWPVGVTPEAESMRNLWTYSAIAALIVGVITWAAMFWAIIAHRKKKDDDGSLPRQTQYNLPVELVFTAIPTVIVAVLDDTCGNLIQLAEMVYR